MSYDIFTPNLDPKNPPGQPYVLQKFHPDQVSSQGIVAQVKSGIKSLVKSSTPPTTCFLTVCRARSGSSLLVDLLNNQPDIRCDGELFHFFVPFPKALYFQKANQSGGKAYGCKFLSYQMVEVQRHIDPRRFFDSLTSQGVQLIHLKRNSLAQALSIAVASQTNKFHSTTGKDLPTTKFPLEIDLKNFERRLLWNLELLKFEESLMKNYDFLLIEYENDLQTQHQQFETITKLANRFGTHTDIVNPTLEKLLPKQLDKMVNNLTELVALLKHHDLEYLIDEYEQSVIEPNTVKGTVDVDGSV